MVVMNLISNFIIGFLIGKLLVCVDGGLLMVKIKNVVWFVCVCLVLFRLFCGCRM